MMSSRFSNCNAQNGIRMMCKGISNTPLLLMAMVEMMVNLVRKMGSLLKKLPQTSKNFKG